MVLAQHAHHLLGLGGLGERGEAAQVDEHHRDLAPVGLRAGRRTLAARISSPSLGEKKRFRRDRRSSSRHLLGARAARASRSTPRAPPPGAATWSCSDLIAQQRLHAREQLGLVDRLVEEVVGARFDALDALLLRVERRCTSRPAAARSPGRRGAAGTRRSPTCPGIITSSSTRSGFSRATCASASSPIAAVDDRVAFDLQQIARAA